MWYKLLLAGVLAMGMTRTALAETKLPGEVAGAEVIEVPVLTGQIDALGGVVYEQVNELRAVRQMRMDLLVPRNHARKPAIVYFPGGGFTSSDHGKFIEMRMALARAGFVVAAAEYRVVPDTFPAPVVDGKAALRYLRAHADQYGIDPDRIGVLGDSAGGYLAQMLGTTNGSREFDQGDFLDQSSDVAAVVTLFGISDLRNIGEGFSEAVQKVHASPAVTEALLINGVAFRDFAGAAIAVNPAKALAASPMGHLDGPKPPFLILHGSADPLVSPLQSAQLYQALKKGGNDASYLLVKGAGHGDISWFQQPVIDRVVAWFQAKLGAPIGEGSK